MTRKIGLSFSLWNGERLERIKNAAHGFEFIDLSGVYSDKDIEECEILFGFISNDVLKSAKNLKWLHAQSAGVDYYLNSESGLSESVILTNSSGAYGIGISEHLIAVTLMLLRKMNEYVRLQIQNKWQGLGSVQTLYQSRVTVIGLGDIGGNYAMRCHSLGAQVRGVVRKERSEKPYYVDELFTVDRLDEAIDGADIVALCLPGTKETQNIMSKQRMNALKSRTRLLSCSKRVT